MRTSWIWRDGSVSARQWLCSRACQGVSRAQPTSSFAASCAANGRPEGLGHDAPSILELQQRQVVDEIARRNCAFEFHAGCLGAGKIDRHGPIRAHQGLWLWRWALGHHFEPLLPRHIGHTIGSDWIEMADFVKGTRQLAGITIVEAVEICPQDLLDGR